MNRRLTTICRAFIALLITGALVAPVAVSFAQQGQPSRSQPSGSHYLKIHDDNLLVLEVRLDNRSTGLGVMAFQHDHLVLLR